MSPIVEERLAEIERLCREHHVERLELFGSAASGAFRARLGDYQRIIGLRNVIAHRYYELDHAQIWEVIERDLPTLQREAEALLGE